VSLWPPSIPPPQSLPPKILKEKETPGICTFPGDRLTLTFRWWNRTSNKRLWAKIKKQPAIFFLSLVSYLSKKKRKKEKAISQQLETKNIYIDLIKTQII
jgi:hypothetical protein